MFRVLVFLRFGVPAFRRSGIPAFRVLVQAMFSSPEAIVEFFRVKKLKLKRSSKTLLACVNLYSTGLVLVCFKSSFANYGSMMACFHNKLPRFRAGM